MKAEKDAYHVELVVPFADLGTRPGRINKLWRINVVRNAHLDTGQETTSWVDMGDYDAHQPEKFGWLWVDAGSVVNADGAALACDPIPLEPGLAAFKVISGRPAVSDGEVSVPVGHAKLLLRKPIEHAAFEVAAEGQLRNQLRFMFAGDAENRTLGWMATYINLLNEINVAYLSEWEHWAPPQPGHLGIVTEVYPRLTHSRWYRLAVRVRPQRVQMLIDDIVHLECPNPEPDARWFGLGFVTGGRLRKLRVRAL